jgi:hypothetical protein
MANAKKKYIVCPVCDGEGKTVNPDIDAHGLTREDFIDDPDFAEAYRAGYYDQVCRGCHGRTTVTRERVAELAKAAEDRRSAAREDGDYEAYNVGGDWRYGA